MSEEQQTQSAPTTAKSPQEGPEFHYHHEAEKTELEKWIRSGAKKIEPYSNQILIGVIAIVVVAAITVTLMRSSGSTERAAWQLFVNTDTPGKYEELAEKYPGSNAATWALLNAGRGYLNEGLNSVFTDRESSDESLSKAKDVFSKVLNDPNATDEAKADAIYGIATCLEVLSGDDLSQATEQYQRLIDNYPDSQHASWAKNRIEQLGEESVIAFYRWFRQQNPSPEDRPLPSDLSPSSGSPMSEFSNFDLLKPDEGSSDAEETIQPRGEGLENTNPVPEETQGQSTENEQPLSAPAFPDLEENKDAASQDPLPPAPELPESIDEIGSAESDASSSL